MKIGIVNDSIMACEVLRRVVLSVPGQDVVWIARDGAEALAMARANRPDLILMDLFMPRTDGVDATRRIMSDSPCAILVVTATVSGHISKVYQAMGHGALDAVDTPVLGTGGEIAGAAPLLRKIDVIGKLIGKTTSPSQSPSASGSFATLVPKQGEEPELHPLVLLGSSTGGPFALAEILAKLPATLKTTIVIVQHVDAAFAPGLCHWLSEQSGRKVELVAEETALSKEKILLAGSGDHLVLRADRQLHYSAEPRSLSYRPSVDVFFQSVARNWPTPGVAAVLTGMGRDGAEGLLELRRLGWKTIAQDKPTSVVWGMPKAAMGIGAADMVLPLPQIAHAISSLLSDQNETQAQARPASL
jgi:two-component system response regulator WspF